MLARRNLALLRKLQLHKTLQRPQVEWPDFVQKPPDKMPKSGHNDVSGSDCRPLHAKC